MPGIVGIFSRRSADECQGILGDMIRSMEYEKFYHSGSYILPEEGIYLGWVVHENSSVDCLPIKNEANDIVLFLAGECFLDKDLLNELKNKGHRFEEGNNGWVVHCYEEKGCKFLNYLNGCFSGFLFDKRLTQAFLFNDRYGMERVYYYSTSNGFYFASEAKALLRVNPESKSIDESVLAEYFGLGCSIDWKSLFRYVNIIPGGANWKLRKTAVGWIPEPFYYFSRSEWENQIELSPEDYGDKFVTLFSKILPRYLQSPVGIGLSLTGGHDTRMIAALLNESKCSVVSYTFCGKSDHMLDAKIGASVARAIDLEHNLLRIEDDFFSNFEKNADRTVYNTDGTLWICGAHEIYLNSKARNFAPVRLTGNYGSEILRGVSTFKPINLSLDLFSNDFQIVLKKIKGQLNLEKMNSTTFAVFKEIPWNLFGTVAAARSQIVFRTPYLDNELVKLAFQAPKEMKYSSQVAKALLLKKSDILSSILTDRGESYENSTLISMLKRLYCILTFKLDYQINEGKPNYLGNLDTLIAILDNKGWIVGTHKYLHYRRWFRKELYGFVKQRLEAVCLKKNPIWNNKFLSRIAEEHRKGKINYTKEINAVLTLDAIERLLL